MIAMKMPKLVDVMSSPVQTDSYPYLSKQIPVSGREKLELVGGTVAFNQLVDASTAEAWASTNTVSGHEITCATTRDFAQMGYNIILPETIKNGHVYFESVTIKSASFTPDNIRLSLTNGWTNVGTPSEIIRLWNGTGTYRGFQKANASGTDGTLQRLLVRAFGTSVTGDTIVASSTQVIDLTQMFGSTIADYVYFLEQASLGTGLTWLQTCGFFTEDYYPYNAGELLSVKTSAHETVGKNLLDITDVRLGSWNKYNIPNTLKPNTTYTFSVFDADFRYGLFLSRNNTETGGGTTRSLATYTKNGSVVFTTPKDMTEYPYLLLGGGASGAGRAPANFQVEYGNTATAFEPYSKTTYPLSNIELRGIPKLVSNELQYVGDTYQSDGTVTRKYNQLVFDGTETFTTGGAGGINAVYIFPSGTPVGKGGQSGVSNIGQWSNNYYNEPSFTDVRVSFGQSGYEERVVFMNALKSQTLAQFKAYLAERYANGNPITVVYPVSTPTAETTDAYESVIPVEENGVESFVDKRTVPMPVGNTTTYHLIQKAERIWMQIEVNENETVE